MSTVPDASWLAERLIPWYREHARDLPWRRDPTPYRVLLSEVMLQQTRVDTVLPYFERFLARWPTLEDLAAAPDEDVLAAWAGLGYYSRARRLLATARAASALGGLPDTVEELRALPGIGPYTAGAIASIAFGRAAPLVDGNVERVICRVDRRTEDPRKEGRAGVWARVAALHEASEPADPSALNQGLMELGATLCTPRSPSCDRCPWTECCLAGAEAESLPRKERKPPPREVRLVSVVVRGPRGVLLVRRPTEGLFGGLWEPPCGVVSDGDVDAWGVGRTERAGQLVHVLTHRRLVVDVVRAERLDDLPDSWCAYEERAWVEDLDAIAVSELARRIIATADGEGTRRGGRRR